MKSLLVALAASTALFASPVAIAGDCGSYSKTQQRQVASTEAGNIVEVADAAGSFKTLLAAATAAGLVPALTGDGPLTVFAPTDEAFAALPAGTVDTLLLPENKDQLTGILKYHVIAGAAVKSGDLAGKVTEADSLNGGLTIDATGGSVMVEGATVIAADVEASNGVIHIIDTVLLPK